jgi:RIO kinase 1
MATLRPSDFDDLDHGLDPTYRGRKARAYLPRERAEWRRKSDHVVSDEILRHAELDRGDLSAAFRPTYTGSFYEREWILSYLGHFYTEKYLTDVLHRVKGGKEANVYCCAAHPDTGYDLLAAKVYRPRMFRQLRNDARYRQGRALLTERGKVVRDDGLLHAVAKKTDVGKEAVQTSWLEHEYQTLLRLHQAGADVPEPVARANHTILMEFVGDAGLGAPPLSAIRVSPREAQAHFDRIVHNIGLMLAHGCIHGDLSAFNVLIWEGEIKLIDFPQVVDPVSNPDAWDIFKRDVTRVCQYFARYGLAPNAQALAETLWQQNAPPTTARTWLDRDAQEREAVDAGE